jgi:hypothetical protein
VSWFALRRYSSSSISARAALAPEKLWFHTRAAYGSGRVREFATAGNLGCWYLAAAIRKADNRIFAVHLLHEERYFRSGGTARFALRLPSFASFWSAADCP